MKKLLSIACAVLACVSVHAASWNDNFGLGNSGNSAFSIGGAPLSVITSVRSNSVYVVTSDSANGAPSFDSVWIKPDLTGCSLDFWTATNSLTVASNGAAGDTTVWLVASNLTGGAYTTLATNDLLVYKGAGDTYQVVVLSGNATSSQGVVTSNSLGQVQIKLFNALSNAPAAGDKIYKMAARFSVNPFTLQNVTNDVAVPWGQWWQLSTRAAPLRLVGEIGEPSVISLTVSNSGGLFTSGSYIRR